MVAMKPEARMAPASHQAPISIADLTSTAFGQKPEKGGRPEPAKNNASASAENHGACR
ncbi:hypothetical protein D3C78_1681890 [compost metagenome]